MTIKLYENPISPHARKVRLLAAELGIPLERVALDFRKGELRSPAYLAKNPNGKIPTLEDDGFVLWESSAILEYLAGRSPSTARRRSPGARRSRRCASTRRRSRARSRKLTRNSAGR